MDWIPCFNFKNELVIRAHEFTVKRKNQREKSAMIMYFQGNRNGGDEEVGRESFKEAIW